MSEIDLKLLPFNAKSVVAIADVDAISIEPTEERAAAPYPPGKVQINGEYWPDGGEVEAPAILTWAHRIRTAQTGAAVVHQDAASTPGMIEGSYKVEVLIDGVVIGARTQTGIVGTSFTYTAEQRAADDGDPDKTVQFRITPVNGAIEGTPRLTDPFVMVGVGEGGPGPTGFRGFDAVAASGTNWTIPFPVGTLEGDRVVIFLTTAYNASLPSGWASCGYFVTGTVWNGIAITKIMDASDVSAGSVTIATAGDFDGAYGVVAFVGDPGSIREAKGDSATSSPVSVATSGAVATTDLALYFASARIVGGTRAIVASRGTEMVYHDGGAGAFCLLSYETELPGGVITQQWTPAGGYDTGMIVIIER